MKVSSPVGEFPFEPERVRLAGGRLRLEGRMGAWPAQVELGPADGIHALRLVGPSLLAPGLAVLVLASLLRRRSKRRADVG